MRKRIQKTINLIGLNHKPRLAHTAKTDHAVGKPAPLQWSVASL